MRGAGVGDGLGVGDAVWARVSSGNFEATRPVAPRTGRSFTKLRRLTFALVVRVFFFMVFVDRIYTIILLILIIL
jgi:hypothetical protein